MKQRIVRTAAGALRYGVPIGSPIPLTKPRRAKVHLDRLDPASPVNRRRKILDENQLSMFDEFAEEQTPKINPPKVAPPKVVEPPRKREIPPPVTGGKLTLAQIMARLQKEKDDESGAAAIREAKEKAAADAAEQAAKQAAEIAEAKRKVHRRARGQLKNTWRLTIKAHNEQYRLYKDANKQWVSSGEQAGPSATPKYVRDAQRNWQTAAMAEQDAREAYFAFSGSYTPPTPDELTMAPLTYASDKPMTDLWVESIVKRLQNVPEATRKRLKNNGVKFEMANTITDAPSFQRMRGMRVADGREWNTVGGVYTAGRIKTLVVAGSDKFAGHRYDPNASTYVVTHEMGHAVDYDYLAFEERLTYPEPGRFSGVTPEPEYRNLRDDPYLKLAHQWVFDAGKAPDYYRNGSEGKQQSGHAEWFAESYSSYVDKDEKRLLETSGGDQRAVDLFKWAIDRMTNHQKILPNAYQRDR